MKVHVTMEVAGRHIDETISGTDADDILAQVKTRVVKELGWKGFLVQPLSPLALAQEAVRRFNSASGSQYAVPQTADEFLALGKDLGYLTVVPDDES